MEFTEALGTLFAACELGPIYIFKEHMGGGGEGGRYSNEVKLWICCIHIYLFWS